eukprot:g2730.t1
MERQVEILQRELQVFEATKTEAEGLLLENNLLRRVSLQQIAVIESLKKQLAAVQGHSFPSYSPVLRRHTYPQTEYSHNGFHMFPSSYENAHGVNQELGQQEDCYTSVPKMPLPVPEFQPHTTAMKRTLSSLEDMPQLKEFKDDAMHVEDQQSTAHGDGLEAENDLFRDSAFAEFFDTIPNTGEIQDLFKDTF